MPTFFNNTLWDIIFLSTILILIVVFIIYAVSSSRRNRKLYQQLIKTLESSQKEFFLQASETLSTQLSSYTETVLVDKINDNYKALITNDLLPSVNLAADRIKVLAECVSQEQQKGMEQLAKKMVALMTAPALDYVKSETEIVLSLNQGVRDFSDELRKVIQTMQDASVFQKNAAEQTEKANNTVVMLSDLLTDKINTLSDDLTAVNQALIKNQDLVAQSSDIALSLSRSSYETQTTLEHSRTLFLQQTQSISDALSESVTRMSHNTELSAEQLIENMCNKMAVTAESSALMLTELHSITEKIELSAAQFSAGMARIYDGLGEQLQQNLAEAGTVLAQSVSKEYQQIALSADNYASTFSNFTNTLSSDLEKHISNLHSVTEQLNQSIHVSKMDMNASADNFKANMENSVSESLGQMDQGLARIVERLVDVVLNIQEAADALPRALKALQREGRE